MAGTLKDFYKQEHNWAWGMSFRGTVNQSPGIYTIIDVAADYFGVIAFVDSEPAYFVLDSRKHLDDSLVRESSRSREGSEASNLPTSCAEGCGSRQRPTQKHTLQ